MNKEQRFKEIIESMFDTYQRKQSDYGNSVGDTFERYGAVSFLTRMRDKLNRLDQLLYYKKQQQVLDEKAIDTIKDLANYSIMFLMELEEAESKKPVEKNDKGYKEGIL